MQKKVKILMTSTDLDRIDVIVEQLFESYMQWQLMLQVKLGLFDCCRILEALNVSIEETEHCHVA